MHVTHDRPLACGETMPSDKPNILIIMTDEHNPFVSEPFGHPFIRTPNIQRLADRGVAPHVTVVMQRRPEVDVWADGRVAWDVPSEVRGSGSEAVRPWARSGR